jgi:hypothetical protein
MSVLPSSIKIIAEQAAFIIANYNQKGINRKPEFEVFTAILEMLYLNGFRAFINGMANKETNCLLDWDLLMGYKTVVDFQIDDLMGIKTN